MKIKAELNGVGEEHKHTIVEIERELGSLDKPIQITITTEETLLKAMVDQLDFYEAIKIIKNEDPV